MRGIHPHMNERPAPSLRFDWAMTVASLWCSGGIMVDAYHHFHTTVETFFEPAHGLLYAGLLASYVIVGIAMTTYHRRGYPWKRALPPGYESTIAGLVVFAIGGVLDMIKHTLWGFEQGFDALLSPTHLVIGAGVFLIVAGPIRSAIVRASQPRGLLAQLPMLLSLASLMELMHWGLQFIFLSEAERMNAPLAPAGFPHDTFTLLSLLYDKEGLGLLAVIIQSLLLMSFALWTAQRVKLAPGALTVLFLVGNLFIAAAHSNFAWQFWAVVLASLCAGALGDILRIDRGAANARWFGAAFVVPAIYWVMLLAVLGFAMNGIWWTNDVIAGSVLFAGLCGVLVAALVRTEVQSPPP